MEAVERGPLKGRADAVSSRPVQTQAPPYHAVDRFLPQSNLRRMKRLLERKDALEAKAHWPRQTTV